MVSLGFQASGLLVFDGLSGRLMVGPLRAGVGRRCAVWVLQTSQTTLEGAQALNAPFGKSCSAKPFRSSDWLCDWVYAKSSSGPVGSLLQ